jgi:hypothetical protein
MFKINKRISKKNTNRKLRKRSRSRSKLIIKGGSERINITVRAIDDDTAIFQTTIHPMDTIKSLKKEILEWFDVRLENQEITYNGIIQPEDRIMGEIPIENNSTVYIQDITLRR